MEKKPLRVVLDSNIIVSAILFGNIPDIILQKVYKKEIQAVISDVILAELNDVLIKRFQIPNDKLKKLHRRMQANLELISPRIIINICRDPQDNKIIEAAVEGNCRYIITGDKDLLVLKEYKEIKIVTAKDFLEEFKAR